MHANRSAAVGLLTGLTLAAFVPGAQADATPSCVQKAKAAFDVATARNDDFFKTSVAACATKFLQQGQSNAHLACVAESTKVRKTTEAKNAIVYKAALDACGTKIGNCQGSAMVAHTRALEKLTAQLIGEYNQCGAKYSRDPAKIGACTEVAHIKHTALKVKNDKELAAAKQKCMSIP